MTKDIEALLVELGRTRDEQSGVTVTIAKQDLNALIRACQTLEEVLRHNALQDERITADSRALYEANRNGYIVAMALMQSGATLDDRENTAMTSFQTRKNVTAAIN